VRNRSWANEEELVARLRAGDESAFAALVDELHGPLVAFARTFTASRSLPEEIVQETWLAVIRGLPRFEGRSALRTWVFGILVRRARTMAVREARQAALGTPAGEGHGTRNGGPPVEEWWPGLGRTGLWDDIPVSWQLEDPAVLQESSEALEVVETAFGGLPEMQRRIVLLRDVEGLSAEEACNILELSETNQRVLLHRGRAAIRRALDRYVREGLKPRSRGTAVGLGGGKEGGGE
jgi:RNA polymerase sigma-70 factor (ECF subfamily)